MTEDLKIEPPPRQPQRVDPARLEAGRRCHKTDRTLGEGDIRASYSADCIGLGKPVRKPFAWRGASMVCTGLTHLRGEISAEAYRLVPLRFLDGEPRRYRDRCEDGDAARHDPNGFYHGIIVSHGGQDFVLCGPPETFQPGEAEQLVLF